MSNLKMRLLAMSAAVAMMLAIAGPAMAETSTNEGSIQERDSFISVGDNGDFDFDHDDFDDDELVFFADGDFEFDDDDDFDDEFDFDDDELVFFVVEDFEFEDGFFFIES